MKTARVPYQCLKNLLTLLLLHTFVLQETKGLVVNLFKVVEVAALNAEKQGIEVFVPMN